MDFHAASRLFQLPSRPAHEVASMLQGADRRSHSTRGKTHMAFFDDALKNAIPGGSISKPLLVAAGTLLLGKMFSGGFGGGSTAEPSASPVSLPRGQAPASQAPATGESGGLLGGLGGLLSRLQQAGYGDVASSWVGSGENASIQPTQLGSALGQQTVSDLARRGGRERAGGPVTAVESASGAGKQPDSKRAPADAERNLDLE